MSWFWIAASLYVIRALEMTITLADEEDEIEEMKKALPPWAVAAGGATVVLFWPLVALCEIISDLVGKRDDG